MASPAVLRVFLDGEEQSIPLKQGSNVIGKNGGSADVRLHAASLSRRHALITVGDKAGDCTVEDLGSTNLSSVVVPGGQMQQMDTGRVYPLPHASTLVMGDVHATFSFSGASVGPPSSSGGLESKTRASTRASEKSSNQRRAGGRSAAANASALATQGRAAGIRHEDAYRHAKELGMNMPYDVDLLWIAEASLAMPLPHGWKEVGGGHYLNNGNGVKTHRRPQTEICANLYRETRRKVDLEEALGTTLDESRLGRILLLDPASSIPLFHYILPGRNTIGKAAGQVDICLASKACSKVHACIELRHETYLLSDLGSTNGTAFGEFPGTASTKLASEEEMEVVDGQLILIGDVECSLALTEGGIVAVEGYSEAGASPRHSEPGDGRESPGHGGGSFHGKGVSFQDSLLAGAAAKAGGGPVDYDEIRKIIREEVSAAVSAGDASNTQYTAGDTGRMSGTGVTRGSPTRGTSQGVRSGISTAAPSRGGESRGQTAPSRGSEIVVPAQEGYSVDEEVRLAEELARVEREVQGAVLEAQEVLGAKSGGGVSGDVPSRKQGFLAKQEARRQYILSIAQRHYRKQAPYSELGAVLLPVGALHRILSYLAPVPHLCVASAVCRAMRRACYATHETITANGDVCRGLWSAVSLKGTRCGDGHSLISGLGPERMGAMLHLNLAGVSTVTDDTLAVVAEQCGALEHLIADRRVDVGPQITDTGIVDIAAKCPNLKSLSIAWCSEVTDVGVKAVAECCPLVEALDLSFCHALSDAGLLALLDNCEALTSLRLEACDRITEQAVVAVAQAAPNLKTISLAGCTNGCTTISVMQIARGCPDLVSIDLTGIAGLQDAAIWQLSRGCRWLRDLSLAWCVQLSDQSCIQVGLNCPLLVQLSLRGCTKVTDAAVVQVAHNCCYLKSLDLRGCHQVSTSGLDAMAMMLPSCHVLFLDKSVNSR